jgi:hypothetical protein
MGSDATGQPSPRYCPRTAVYPAPRRAPRAGPPATRSAYPTGAYDQTGSRNDYYRKDYQTKEVQDLVEKIRNGLGHWLTFVTEPDVDSTNNRAERTLREQIMLRKMFRSLRSAEGVRIHETITTMLATWKRRGLDPPQQLQSVLVVETLRHDKRHLDS